MTSLYFQIASFFCMLLIMIVYFTKKRVNNIETKIFSVLSIVNFIGIILDILLVYFEYVIPKDPSLYIITKFYSIYILVWTSLFATYIFYISFKDRKRIYQYHEYFLWFNLIFTIICSIFIFILNVEIYDDGKMMYTYGASIDLLMYFCLLYFVLIIISILINIKNIANKKYYPVFSLILMVLLAFIARSLNPGLLLTTSIITYINLIMFFTIENPDMKILHEMELAKEVAEKANQHKSDFLSSMSHEIRTPLNAIIGLSEIDMDDDISLEEIKQNSKDIYYASNILLEIVGNVLDMSRIESGNVSKIDMVYKPYDVFENIIKIVDYRFKEKNLSFITNIAPDIPKTLSGDPANIKKILLNLLTNAAKYTEKGHVDLVINCVNKANICRLIISVEDTGRGIKPENINKLFTRFNRLDEDKNTTTEGTGLGLAITKKIVEMLEGTITVQSIYGSGSKFTVVLNQKIVDLKNIEQFDNEKNNQTVSTIINTPNISHKKIMIVDDNLLNLKVVNKLLVKYNVDVIEFTNGQSCIDYLDQKNKVDLILLDEMMPGMSGTETLSIIKSKGYKMPIIVLTADVEDSAKEKYIKIGYNDYLGKPIDRVEFSNILNKYLK